MSSPHLIYHSDSLLPGGYESFLLALAPELNFYPSLVPGFPSRPLAVKVSPLIVLRGCLPLKRPVVSGAFVGVVALPARVSTLDFVGLSCCFDCFFHIIPKKFVSNWDIDIAAYGPHVFGLGWL